MAELDLNLLRIFDVLIETESVTKAATRLSLTQSAISHALSRLRYSLRDPLFVRTPRGIQPTTRAKQIAPGIREALLQFRSALSPLHFNPAEARRRFTVSASTYFCTLLLPELLARTRKAAPGVSITVIPQSPGLMTLLDEGVADFAVGTFRRVPNRLKRETLLEEDLVWVASADNTYRHDPPVWEDIAGNPRLVTTAGGLYSGFMSHVSEGGLEQRVVAADGEADDEGASRVYDLVTALAVVGRTDFISWSVRRFAERYAKCNRLVLIEPPQKHEPVKISMVWHTKLEPDAGLAWLRNLVHDVAHSLSRTDSSTAADGTAAPTASRTPVGRKVPTPAVRKPPAISVVRTAAE